MAMIVLHIAEAPGGVERYLVTLLKKMKKYEEYEHILVCSSSFDKKKFEGIVRSIIIVDEMRNAISFNYDFQAIVAVRKIIKKCMPDIIYCHSSKAGAIGRIANIGIKNKLVYNAHGWAFNIKSINARKVFFYRMIEKMLAKLTDKIICISEYEKISAQKNKICRADKMVVINNGIDFDEYQNLNKIEKNELNIPEDAYVVGTIGRITEQKATDVFVRMAVEVKKKIPNAFFVIVGDDIGNGLFRRKIEKQINDYGIGDSFLITGWVSNPLDYMCVFDAAALLSRWEGFGLVLPEYMYMGKPIVASKADAIPYVVGDAGLLVNVDDYNKAAELIVRLYTDKELEKEIIEREQRRVKVFDAEKTAEKVFRLFNRLI